MAEAFSGLTAFHKAAIVASVALAGFLIIDPIVLDTVRGFDPGTYRLFRSLTHVGRSNWILIPSGVGILLLAWMRARTGSFRVSVAYGYAAQLLVFLFATIALSGLASSLIKNVLGRARPKLYEQLGPLEFQPFTFDSDFASFPSGHATTVGALAGVLAIIWPQARIPLFLAAIWIASTRFFIGAHYLSDVVAGCLFGLAFAYSLRERLAQRRWLFEITRDGSIALRGRALRDAATQTITNKVKSPIASKVESPATPLLTDVKSPGAPRQ